ncbi:hypothetical protein ACFE04_014476 [Oxalis oulophora]
MGDIVHNKPELAEESMAAQPKAVVVGGSIAGLSCAHVLISAGWQVVVLDKSSTPPTGTPTGAGLGIDPVSISILQSWLKQPLEMFYEASLPIHTEQNQTTDGEANVMRILTRDENYNFRALHWADLHYLLYNALPSEIFSWGHFFLSFTISDDKTSVKVKSRVLPTNEIVEIDAHLLVAADGSQSSIRHTFLPDLKLRYCGYVAWRGVLDYSGAEDSEVLNGIRRLYPDIGRCLYFNLTSGAHSVLYELPNKKFNWLWYVNQPEPELKGNSVTMKVNDDMIKKMHQEAEKVWPPEFVRLIKQTKDPFVNVIYDCDPLQQIYWGNVVLVGDAAHPSTPNGGRGTTMTIADAAVLGKCLEKWQGIENLRLALDEYQSIRLPVTTAQVLHSRRMGRLKQGLKVSDDEKPFDPRTASPEDCRDIQMKNMPFFYSVPSILSKSLSL